MYVVFVVPSNFPNGDAAAVRDLAFAKIYQELGYKTILIGMGRESKYGVYEGIEYYSLYATKSRIVDHIKQFIDYKSRCTSCINNIVAKERHLPSVIHINDINEKMVTHLVKFAKRNGNIPIIHDSTEWYSPCEFKFGKIDKAYILKNRTNRKVIRLPIKVIAISSYLEKHFISKGLETIRVPVIMDVMNSPISINDSDLINLIYAGSPATKDYLKEIVEAIVQLEPDKQERIRFHVLGVDEKQLLDLSDMSYLPQCIKVYGRVPREKVIELMLKMDFSLLLRPSDERYTKAGFPTKSVEAMSHGVAMICNISSDLGLYLENGKNSVVVSECSTEAFKNALLSVLTLKREDINVIKNNARKLAEMQFDYRSYSSYIDRLIRGKYVKEDQKID